MKRLVLVTITALSLVACGNSDEPVAATATGAPTSNAQSQPVQPQDQPEATQPVVAGEDAQPNGPVDSNTEELPENNSIPDATVPVTCLDVSSSSVTEAVNSLPLVFADSPWVATRMGDPCASFTWVEALPSGATVSSPTHLLFFHSTEYLGTATLEPYGFTSVAAQSADTITVNYRWPLAGDANANPTGGPVTIDYRWDGTQVTMIGTLPPEVTS
ncbi:LppP/LprE family lipoprotein [Rhodococcoides fascians A25f]|uniref:LppP/LprE family lipoprotein n=1 Tax=Rhodococcoides fascians TaxID=1828 RepID=UPI000559CD6E|nr:LppP/LprE family lipoprotein [Rhodococcus fascians]QII07664.1 LppP/LprE family lipoprotein [Rhodococcus fascians A25f]